MFRAKNIPLTLSLLALATLPAYGVHPSRGLWIGEVALDAVNEATGAVGDSNTYEFTDPETLTPTSDAAFLRLIIHVNGAGQAELLKSVALVADDTDAEGNIDLVLLTDPALYSEYPGIARRIASAFYDFGDPHTVEAVQQLVDVATDKAVEDVFDDIAEASTVDALTTSGATGLLDVIVSNADVSSSYLDSGDSATSFITDNFFTLSNVQAMADAVAVDIDAGGSVANYEYSYDASSSYAPFSPSAPAGSNFAAVLSAAEDLVTASFYGDTRGVDAIVNILVAAAANSSGADLNEKKANAFLAAEAAWHNAGDLDQAFNRFLASSVYTSLPSVLPPLATQEAIDEEPAGGTEFEIAAVVKTALLEDPAVQAAYVDAAILLSESLNDDPRGQRALDSLIDAAADAAAAQVLISTDASLLEQTVASAVDAAFQAIDSAPVFASAPSALYSDFVTSVDYTAAAQTAAETAASEANFQYDNGLDDEAANEADMRVLVENAVLKALVAIRNDAAALPLYSVKLDGGLESGGALSGEFYLPALAPTNPFLHRLHPDHTTGIAITRRIMLSVDAVESGDFVQAEYGVSQLSGTYTEEIFGLHKPLGSNQDIGLKTSGNFTLNRLTFADTLNF